MRKARFLLALLISLGGVAAAADANALPNRLSSAQPGEWATYRLPDGYIQKLTVTERTGRGDEALVTVRVENIYDGDVVNTSDVTQEAGPVTVTPSTPVEDGVTVSVRNEIARVGDRDVVAGVAEIRKFLGVDDEDNTVTEWWSSNEIPVFGIVKKVTDGQIEWELDEFGFAEK